MLWAQIGHNVPGHGPGFSSFVKDVFQEEWLQPVPAHSLDVPGRQVQSSAPSSPSGESSVDSAN